MQHNSMIQSSPAHRRVGSMDSLIVGSERAGGAGSSPLRRSSGSTSGALGGLFGPLPTSPWHQPMATAHAPSSGAANSRGSPYSAHSFFAGHDAESLSLAASSTIPSSVSLHPMHSQMQMQMASTGAPSPSMLGGYPPLLAGLGLSDFDPSPLSLGEMHRAGAPLTPVRVNSAVAPAEAMPSPVIVSNVRSSSRKRNASLLARESQASAAAMEQSDPEEAEPEESPRAHAAIFPAAPQQQPQQQPPSRFQSARPSALAVAALPTSSARLAAQAHAESQADTLAESDDDQVKPISASKASRATKRRVAASVSDSGSDNNSGDSGEGEGSTAEEAGEAEDGEEDFGSDQDAQSEASEVSSDVSFPESGSRRKSSGKAGAAKNKASSRSKGARSGRKQEPAKKRATKPSAAKSSSDKKKAAAAAASAGDDASVSSSPDAADDAAMEDAAAGGELGADCSMSPMACGRLAADGTRIFEEYIPFFGRVVELYTATLDPLQRVLVRASTLAARFSCATNKVGMYLSRRRLVSDGLFQAKSFSHKPAGRTGLKAGGYFLSHEVCLAFEAHYSKHSNKADEKGAAEKGRGRSSASKRATSKRLRGGSSAAAAGDDSIPESQISPLVGTDKAVAREAAAQGLTLSQVSPRLKISPTQRLEGPYSTGGWPVSAAIAPAAAADQAASAAASAATTPKEPASAPVRKRKLAGSVKKEKDDSGITVKLEPQQQSQSADSSVRHLPRDTLVIVKQEPTESKPQKKQRAVADPVSRSPQPAASLRVPPSYADSPPTLSQSRPPSSTSMSYRSSATTTAANSQVVTPRMMDSHSPRAAAAAAGLNYPAMHSNHGLHPPHHSSSASAASAGGFFGVGSMEGSMMLMADEHSTQDLYSRARKPMPQPMQQMPAQALSQHLQHQQHHPAQGYAHNSSSYVDYHQQMRHHHHQQQQAHASSRQHGHTLAVPLHPASQQHSQQSSQQSSPNPLASLNLSSDSIRSLQAKVEQALRTLQAAQAQGSVPTSQTTSSASSVSDYTQQIGSSSSSSYDAPFVTSVSLAAPLSSSHPLHHPHPLMHYGSSTGDSGSAGPNFFQSF